MVYTLSSKHTGEDRTWHEVFGKLRQAKNAGKDLEKRGYKKANVKSEYRLENNQYCIIRESSFFDGA